MTNCMPPIIDLHCDLLSYLEMHPTASPLDPAPRCSYPHFKKGNVRLQTLAIFTLTRPGSTKSGENQVRLFQELFIHYHPFFEKKIGPLSSEKVQLVAAFENAAAFCEEDEPLSQGISRLEKYHKDLGSILYISLTWDGENRFGGGVGAKIGLKEDGKRLLEWMHQKNIAIDLSHTSDALAYDILNAIDKNSLSIPIMASHSNFRSISNYPRNLPDELAIEIIRRKGLIGLNFFAPFIGKNFRNLLHHVEHGFMLKGQKSLCFGADFFCDADFPHIKSKYNTETCFFPESGDASKYPSLLQLLKEELSLTQEEIQDIASGNALAFSEKMAVPCRDAVEEIDEGHNVEPAQQAPSASNQP